MSSTTKRRSRPDGRVDSPHAAAEENFPIEGRVPNTCQHIYEGFEDPDDGRILLFTCTKCGGWKHRWAQGTPQRRHAERLVHEHFSNAKEIPR
jgi:hypothetical protein